MNIKRDKTRSAGTQNMDSTIYLRSLRALIISICLVSNACFQSYKQGDTQENSIDITCCIQCINAQQQDARGYDTTSEKCSYYQNMPVLVERGTSSEEKIISSECADYFNENSMIVSECNAIVSEE